MIITLKDGSVKEYNQSMSVIDIAKDISEGLARNACAGEIDGQRVDLRTVVSNDCHLSILTFDDKGGRDAFRHTASHITAQAIKRLYPETKLSIGPSVDDGFYYDVDREIPFTVDDFEAIENEIKKIIKEDIAIERYTMPRNDALNFFKEQDEIYKVMLIEDLPEDAEISFYKQDDFTDLCAGPHLMSTKQCKAIKLTKIAGAYWRGNAKNKMYQRIYGTAFPKASELQEYLDKMEEAAKRDHRKIGKEMSLFMTDDLIGKGLPMFLPNGYTVWQELENYIKEKERRLGYQHVMTPCVGTVQLYETSGHWAHYKDNMFPVMEVEDENFVLRPMNCPHHMMIYANKPHSYKELPIRIGEIAHDFRFEASGSLKGIERGRHFCQNDAHLFVTPDQIKDEVKRVVDLIFDVYKDFGIKDYRCVLSLRDPADTEKYHPDDDMWNNAEDALRQVLNEIGIDYTEEIGEAAFYGPKLDVNVRPAVGAEYTLSTCQLDFCLPAKFKLKYKDRESIEQTPVVLHRAILGSLDRFMAYIIEETKGQFPTWLSPVQVKVLPLSDKYIDYADKVYNELYDAGIRVEIDKRAEKLGYKIREARLERVPYQVVVGAKEEEEGTISLRSRFKGDEGSVVLADFIKSIKDEIDNRVVREIEVEENK